MIRILLWALAIWFLYKLIFGFIIPVYRTTRQVRRKFREMHDHIQEQQMRQQQGYQQPKTPQKESKASSGDYIDFEEVK